MNIRMNIRRLFVTVVVLAALAGTPRQVLALCTTHTLWLHGRLTVCTVCCSQFGCTTTCF
jgi:hypothetical protein